MDNKPTYQQVLRKLESVSTVQIPIKDVEDAIAEVAEDNGNHISETMASALAKMILKSANVEQAGTIDRVQLKEAIIANSAKMNAITEETLPETNPVVDPVMNILNSTNDVTIQKKDLKKALLDFNDESPSALDYDSVVNDVFNDKAALDRSAIRQEMNQNQEVQDVAAAEPIQDQIMR